MAILSSILVSASTRATGDGLDFQEILYQWMKVLNVFCFDSLIIIFFVIKMDTEVLHEGKSYDKSIGFEGFSEIWFGSTVLSLLRTQLEMLWWNLRSNAQLCTTRYSVLTSASFRCRIAIGIFCQFPINFLQIAPYTSVLINGIYWAVDSPKLLTLPDAKHLLLPSHTPWLPKSVGAPALPHRSVLWSVFLIVSYLERKSS